MANRVFYCRGYLLYWYGGFLVLVQTSWAVVQTSTISIQDKHNKIKENTDPTRF